GRATRHPGVLRQAPRKARRDRRFLQGRLQVVRAAGGPRNPDHGREREDLGRGGGVAVEGHRAPHRERAGVSGPDQGNRHPRNPRRRLRKVGSRLLGPSTVADASERELVARIQQQLPPTPPWVLVGIGDDAAIVEPERNRAEVLTVDAIVEGVHFDRAFVPPDAIGHRALAVNLSDLAAMGAAPRLALLSMALPSTLPLADFDGVVSGFTSLAAQHRLQVIGGNLTRSPGPLVIDVTLVGTVKRRQALTRGGAKPGDDLYVSGAIGAAAAGLRLLRRVVGHQSSGASLSAQSTEDLRLRLMTGDSRLTTDDWRLMTAYLT